MLAPEVLQGAELPLPTAIDNARFTGLLSSVSWFPTPPLGFPGITCQISFLHLNPCPRACFWGTQMKIPYLVTMTIMFCAGHQPHKGSL